MARHSAPFVVQMQRGEAVDVSLGGVVTARSCGALTVALLRRLLFLRGQLPYDCARLELIVRRSCDADDERERAAFASAAAASDALHRLVGALTRQFSTETKTPPLEVLLLFGPSVLCAREAYSLLVPSASHLHDARNHVLDENKLVRTLFRMLVLSKGFNEIMSRQLTPTNLYVLLRKKSDLEQSTYDTDDDFFLPIDPPDMSSKTMHTIINLDYDLIPSNCCNELNIYNDPSLHHNSDAEVVSLDEVKQQNCVKNFSCDYWYQAIVTLKGYKDTFINGRSVSNMWI